MPRRLLSRVEHLISSLSVQEKAFFSAFLGFSNNHIRGKNKILQLFQQVDNQHPFSDSQIRNKRKNYEILESKILDTLLTDYNLHKVGKYHDNPNNNLVLHKESLKIQLLHNRGVSHRAFRLAQNLISQCLKLEKYDISLNLIRLQLSMSSVLNDPNLFKQKLEEQDTLEYKGRVLSKSIQFYQELKLKKNLGVEENLDIFLSNTLQALSGYYEKVPSPTIKYIHNYFLKECLEQTGQIHEALSVAVQLYSDFDQLPNRETVRSVYEVVFEQARISLEIGKYDTALTLFDLVIKRLQKQDIVFNKALQLIFLTHYLQGNYPEAKRTLDFLKTSQLDIEELHPLHRSKWIYYSACLNLKLGAHKGLYKGLSHPDLGRQETPAHKLKYRFLQLIATIDNEDFDLADHSLEALRKFIERNQLTNSTEMNYYRPLYYVMNQLKANGYDFSLIDRDLDPHTKVIFNPSSLSYDLSFAYEWLMSKLNIAGESYSIPVDQDNRIFQFYESGRFELAYS